MVVVWTIVPFLFVLAYYHHQTGHYIMLMDIGGGFVCGGVQSGGCLVFAVHVSPGWYPSGSSLHSIHDLALVQILGTRIVLLFFFAWYLLRVGHSYWLIFNYWMKHIIINFIILKTKIADKNFLSHWYTTLMIFKPRSGIIILFLCLIPLMVMEINKNSIYLCLHGQIVWY